MTLVQKEIQKVYMWKEPYTVDTRQGPCPDGFHIPTNDEWQSVWDIVSAFVSGGGGSLGGYLYMPYAGYRDGGTSNVYNQGTNGAYWSCVSSSSATGYRMYFLSSAVYPKQAYYNTYGCSIRPFKNEVINPIDSGSTLKSGWVWTYHSGSNNYGIAYNNSEGLISLSSDGVNWYTLSDKNLGATTVYDYTNPQASSYGNFYQWGNNYGFPNSGSVTTSSAKVDASAYGGGNYYSSSTFILASSAGWDSSNNNDLRGGETGVISGGGDILIRPELRTIEYLVVGGGGDGGVGRCGYGGGGGAGGVIQGTMDILKGTAFNVTVGTASPTCGTTNGANGCPSCLGEDIIAYGGGGGGYGYTSSGYAANAGGSGGGGGSGRSATSGTLSSGGATCNVCYGKAGGSGYGRYAGGGGGGYTCVGTSATNQSCGGIGGCGLCSCISGAGYWYGSGGSGGGGCSRAGYCGGGSGAGLNSSGGNATTYGSGGGGGSSSSTSNTCYGGKGCKGVVIVRYPTSCGYSVSGGTCYTCGDYTIHCFTSSGTLTVN